jgi:hypothetical protein
MVIAELIEEGEELPADIEVSERVRVTVSV